MSDATIVKQHGKTYEIPGIWLAGMVHGERLRGNKDFTIHDAVNYWILQATYQEEETR